jgi:lipopolysaccharide transport system ATP-binding protein
MSLPVISFCHVSKSYPIYHHVTGGIKSFLFHFPEAWRSLRFSRYEVLRDISFSVPKGEALGIIGRNGAGKSTTLGLIAGVLRPTSGTVDVTRRVSPLLELGAGFHRDLTGRENIELNGVLLGLSRKQVLCRQDSILEFSGIGDLIEQPVRTYSSGQLARLAFSVVVHLDPQILLVDEILTAGDASFQEKCVDKMVSFKKDGVTIILVSHMLSQVEQLCDRAIWLEDRTVKATASPAEVVQAYDPICPSRAEFVR